MSVAENHPLCRLPYDICSHKTDGSHVPSHSLLRRHDHSTFIPRYDQSGSLRNFRASTTRNLRAGVQHAKNMLISRLTEKAMRTSRCIDEFPIIDHVSLSANEMTSQPGLYPASLSSGRCHSSTSSIETLN